jgi:hypothetical protein
MSIVALYHRLASQPKHKLIIKWLGGMLLGHTISVSVTAAHMCDPIVWGPEWPNGCINMLFFNYFNAAFHILTDIMIAVVPIPLLKGFKLQINQKKRIGLVVVFAVGGLTIIGTIAIALTNSDFTW